MVFKFDDISYAPGYIDEEGNIKIIVTDPDAQYMLNGVERFYSALSIYMSRKLSKNIPESYKENSCIFYKVIKFNDIMYIEEKDVFEQHKMEYLNPVTDTEFTLLSGKDFDFLIPVPVPQV